MFIYFTGPSKFCVTNVQMMGRYLIMYSNYKLLFGSFHMECYAIGRYTLYNKQYAFPNNCMTINIIYLKFTFF